MNKVELLAPAGSLDALKAAVNNGADAVYLGGKNFSARAFATNFSHEDLLEAIKYCHLRNVRVFVTVNTLLNDDEIINALKECDFYYKNNVDALLIQDLGLYYLLKERYPDFELHCSTQMHVSNISGIKTAKKLGFKRVVIPRESSLDFIQEACKEDIEIECFIHGAICVSYSGQCLMSSVSNNRSANKGMCAQCCRLDYKLYKEDDKNILNEDNPYILSPKDMFLLEDIPELIKAGVSSFKIEGRMKSPAYVAYVTRTYRQAIDAYYNNEEFKLDKEKEKNLKVLFNRDFTDGYLKNNLEDLFAKNKPNHLGILIGKVISSTSNTVKIKLYDELNQFDGVRIVDKNHEDGFIVNYLYKDEKLVNNAKENDIIELKTTNKFNKDSLLYKTIDSKLEEELNNYELKRIPLNLKIDFMENEEIKISINVDNKEYIYDSGVIAYEAKNASLSKERIIEIFSKLNDSAYLINDIEVNTNNAFLPVKDINEIRRQLISFIDEKRLNSFERNVIKRDIELSDIEDEDHELEMIESNQEYDGVINISHVSPINMNNEYSNVIADVGGILEDKDNKIAYYTLNIYNSYAYEFLKRLNFKYIILSTELNKYEIDRLIAEYEKRNNKKIKPYAYFKGDRTLMYLKGNPFKEYMDDNDNYLLRHGENIYSIKENDNYLEIKQTNDFNNDFNDKCLKFYIK